LLFIIEYCRLTRCRRRCL